MVRLSLIMLAVMLLAAILGFTGMVVATEMAKLMFYVLAILFLGTLIASLIIGRKKLNG